LRDYSDSIKSLSESNHDLNLKIKDMVEFTENIKEANSKLLIENSQYSSELSSLNELVSTMKSKIQSLSDTLLIIRRDNLSLNDSLVNKSEELSRTSS
jgi:uncharacterized coiled-coil DUF342 family protein